MKLNADGFEGVVVLKNWMVYPDGRSYLGFYGKVSIIRDKDAVGFEVSGGESNWMVRIEGEKVSVNVLGCQVRGAYEGEGLRPTSSDNVLVVP